jgi:hypothetical protein
MVKIVLGFLIGIVALCGAFGQDLSEMPLSEELKGNVKAVVYDREILVIKGKNFGPIKQRLSIESYDREGRLINTSVFGNGELRFSFDYSAKLPTVSVYHFDKDGRPTTVRFEAHANAIKEAQLCSRYSIREETDAAAKVQRITETCEDGRTRSSTVYERDEKHRLFREVRTDSLERSWESRYRYDDKVGELMERIFLVDDRESPKYWQTVNYVDYRYDKKGNWVHVVGSSFYSKAPNQLAYQFIEKRTIEYYPD